MTCIISVDVCPVDCIHELERILAIDQVPPLPAELRELFDLTPPELVDAVVTEDGTYRTDDVRALVDRTPFLRAGYALLRAAL